MDLHISLYWRRGKNQNTDAVPRDPVAALLPSASVPNVDNQLCNLSMFRQASNSPRGGGDHFDERILSFSSHPVLTRGCLANQKMRKSTGDSFYLSAVLDCPQCSVPKGKDMTLRIIRAIEVQKGLFLTRLTVEFSAVTFERPRFMPVGQPLLVALNESWHYMLVLWLCHLRQHPKCWSSHPQNPLLTTVYGRGTRLALICTKSQHSQQWCI